MNSSEPALRIESDDVDDLIYLCRAGDLTELKDTITALGTKYDAAALQIIQNGIDLDTDGLGSRNTLLHYPAANGSLEIVQYLLSQTSSSGSDAGFINRQNVSGNTALHWAAMNGHADIVKALIKAGADPTIVNGAGRDAVVEAEWSSKDGSDECATWMLQECSGLETGVAGEAKMEVEDVVNGTEPKIPD